MLWSCQSFRCVLLLAGQVSLQPVEPAFPGRDMSAKPVIGAPKHPWREGACPYAPGFLRRDEAAAFEYANMLQHRRQADLEGLGEFADRGVSQAQAGDNRAPGRIGEGGEGQAQAMLIVCHRAN